MKNLKTFRNYIFIIIVAVLLNSCAAFHTGYMTNSASLSSANFFYAKRNVKGVSTAHYFLGIGGLKKETLVDDAKQDMLFNGYKITDNQALVNLTVNFKRSFYLFGIYSKVSCVVTADVVQFKEAETEEEK